MTDNNLENQPATKGDVALVKGDIQLLKGDVALVKDDIKLLKGDVALVKGDIKLLKGDVALLRGDIELAKTELRSEMNSIELKLYETIEKAYISQVQADSKLEQKMDKMMAMTEKFHSNLMSAYERTVVKGEMYDQKATTHAGILNGHTAQLADHETRIQKLETTK